MSESVNELLDRVNRGLTEYANYERTTRNITDLTGLEEQVRSICGSLRLITTGFAVLDQVGVSAERPVTAGMAATCRDAADQVHRTRSLPQDPPLRLKSISDVEREASTTARETWRAYVEGSMPGLDGLSSLADTLGSVGIDRAQVAALKDGVRDLRTLSRQMPDTSAVAHVAEAVQAVQAALAALVGESDEGNEAVRRFVDSVGRGGAHVQTLTPVVRGWMRSRGIEQSFKIVPGRPANE